MWILFNIYNFFLNILFPARCFICKKANNPLCKNCLAKISKTVTIKPHTTSFFSYRDQDLKKIIHSVKYFHRKDLLPNLIRETIPNITQNVDLSNSLLVPIPAHTFRKLLRGYNQSELIAKNYSEVLNIPYNTNILIRKRLTLRQVKSKNKTARINNQKNSFRLKEFEKYLDKNIILVDDITTTGATIQEARKIFIQKGFKSVEAITLAN